MQPHPANATEFCGQTLDLVALEDEAFAVSAEAGVLFHLNTTARHVLEAASSGASFSDISKSVAEAHDLSPEQVLEDITALTSGLEQGVQKALAHSAGTTDSAPPLQAPVHSATYASFGRHISITYPNQEMAAICHPPLAPFQVGSSAGDDLIADLKENQDHYCVRCGLAEVHIEKSPGALMTALQRAILCHDVPEPGLFNVVVHAGSVVGGKGAWLVGGASGRGKSTLVTALDVLGFPVLSDDLIPLDLDRKLAFPMPLGLSLKEAGWETALRLRPDIANIEPVVSASGKKTRFAKPLHPACDKDRKGHQIAGLLLPQRRSGATPELTPMSLKEAMVGLCDRFGRFPLDPADLERLIGLLEHLPRYRLTYGEVDDILPALCDRL
ncbi:MAG: hypothetical protein AAGF81_01375 [Pseudomonadota bacterium]